MKSSETRTPCILVADDQPDVLEALRFLIKGEGYLAVLVNSPAAAIGPVASRGSDGPQLHARYHQRPGRARSPQPHTVARYHAAGDRDDGVGQRGTGRGGDAPRGARFHPEAVG